MTLCQLEYLIAIADLGSISACADYCDVTQPTVTNQIHQLEKELETSLLIRNARGATLTDTGEKIVAQAKKVLYEANKIPTIAEKTRHLITGKIILGVSPVSPVSIHHFPHIYQSFHKDFPEISVEVLEIDAMHLADKIRNQRVNLALTPLPLYSTKIQYELLWNEELVIISSPDAHLSDPVSMNSLYDHDFVSLKSGFSLNLTAAHLAQQACFEPHIVAEASSVHGLIGLVCLGAGIAIVPKGAVALESNAGLISVSRLSPTAYRSLAMAFRSREEITPAVDVFMKYIRSYAQSEWKTPEKTLSVDW